MNNVIVCSGAKELQSEVDKYLESTSYDKLISLKQDDIYEQMYKDICKMAIDLFPTIDVTNLIELSIRKDRLMSIIEITGYIKVDYNKFVVIEKTYKGERNIV